MFNFTLDRKIDIKYQSNKIILIISAIIAIIGYFITNEFISGLYLGIGTFLTWALAKEVYPKNGYSSFLCVALSLVNLFYYEKIYLLILVWIILLLRMVNETSGKDISLLDPFLVLSFSIYLSIVYKSSIYLAAFVLAMVSVVKIKGKSKMALISLIIAASVFLVENSYFRYLSAQDIDFSNNINLFIIIAIFIFLMAVNFFKNEGVMDDKGNIIEIKKVRSAQLLFGNIILFLFLFSGIGLNNLVIYFSVIIGVIVYSFIKKN